MVDMFLALPCPKKQIVSLGAGFDTLFWRLKVRINCYSIGELIFYSCCQAEKESIAGLTYYEVDFMEVTAKKCAIIAKNAQLKEPLKNFKTGQTYKVVCLLY